MIRDLGSPNISLSQIRAVIDNREPLNHRTQTLQATARTENSLGSTGFRVWGSPRISNRTNSRNSIEVEINLPERAFIARGGK